MSTCRCGLFAAFLCLGVASAVAQEPGAAPGERFDERVTSLLERLDASRATDRLAAEEALTALAAESADNAERVLANLPQVTASMPAGIRSALDRIRLRVEKQIAERATGPSEVTLRVAQAPLPEVLAAFSEQTGNRLVDQTEAFGGEEARRKITLTLKDEPFWPAIDRLLDEAGLGVYPYGEEGALTLIKRGAGERSRFGRGTYAGPFRLETVRVAATRGLRDADASRLDVLVEVAWEPRLRPIAISQPFSELKVIGAGGAPLAPRTPEQSIDLETSVGCQALELNLSLVLPEPRIERIERIEGRLEAMIPAAKREFRVKRVGEAPTPVVQRFGDVTVTLERFEKQNAIWELHARVRLENAGDALASHRGWVFQNACYLVDADGKRVEHAGFETTMQTESEVGLAYLFDLSGAEVFGFDFNDAAGAKDEEAEPVDPNELTWVYETPTGVYTIPVPWRLGPIELP